MADSGRRASITLIIEGTQDLLPMRISPKVGNRLLEERTEEWRFCGYQLVACGRRGVVSGRGNQENLTEANADSAGWISACLRSQGVPGGDNQEILTEVYRVPELAMRARLA
jgi:hypothetical protein